MTPQTAPTITTQPGSASVNVGSTPVFTSGAAGNPVPTCQWFRSNDGGSTWVAIAGATGASYTLPAATAGDNQAMFRMVATNSLGAATSNAATLSVEAVVGQATQIPLAPQSAPLGIAEGPDGNIWFTNQSAGQIGRIQSITHQIALVPLADATCSPTGITAGPDGKMWFTEQASGKIGNVSLDGQSIQEYPANGQFPTGITAGPDGNLWYTLQGANAIGRMTPAGVGVAIPVATAKAGPLGITLGKDGNLWFTEQTAGQIAQITPSGSQKEWVIPTPAGGQPPVPQGIVATSDGSLWFADKANDRIVRFVPPSPATTRQVKRTGANVLSNDALFTSVALPAGSNPMGLATDTAGNIWVADQAAGKVTQVKPDLTTQSFALPTTTGQPTNLVVGADGNLYVTQPGGDAITQVVATATPATVSVSISPSQTTAYAGASTPFCASVLGNPDSRVTWSVQEGASGGTITASGLYTAPAAAGTYHVVATSVASPTQSATATITVMAAVQQSLASFSAAASTLKSGDSTTLTAVFTGGTATIDQGIGAVTSGVPVSTGNLSATTTYTLTFTPVSGPAQMAQVTVNVSQVVTAKPVIQSFTATPTTIGLGAGSILSWNVTGAASLSIDNGVGPLPTPQGTVNVTPTLSTSYTLTATNALGTATSVATVVVDATPFHITSFASRDYLLPWGGSTLLNWGYLGIPGSLSLNGSAVSGNTATVTPIARQLYTLSGSNLKGADAATLKVAAQGLDLLAGSGAGMGYKDGVGTAASFGTVYGLAGDAAGNVYVADTSNHTIRKIATDGTVTTLAGSPGKAGSADGQGAAARFYKPRNIVVDLQGNLIVSDTGNQTLRKIAPDGTVSTFAGAAGVSGSTDGSAVSARFKGPQGLGMDSAGNIYVADSANRTVRKIDTTGQVSTLAGKALTSGNANGNGANASFESIVGLAVTPSGTVYVADATSNLIRMITPAGDVTTVAGTADTPGSLDGTGTAATFNMPFGLALDAAGNLYVGDVNSNAIRRVTPGGVVTTVTRGFGTNGDGFGYADGPAATAKFRWPFGLAMLPSGTLAIVDQGSCLIRTLTSGGVVGTLAGNAAQMGWQDGTGASAQFANPTGLTLDAAGNLIVADGGNGAIRKVTPAGVVTTLSGGPSAPAGSPTYAWLIAVALDAGGNIILSDSVNQCISRLASDGTVTSLLTSTSTTDLAVASSGNILFPGVNCIKVLQPNGTVYTLAGQEGSTHAGSTDGYSSQALFNNPYGLAIDKNGNVYVADRNNNAIRMITQSGQVTTLAGKAGQVGSADGIGQAASFNQPSLLRVAASGNVYVLDYGNQTIRKITPAGVVTTVAGLTGLGQWVGGPLPGGLCNPTGLAVTPDEDLLVSIPHAIIRITAPAPAGAPTIAVQPLSQIGLIGFPVTFSVTPCGYAPFTYQWFKGGSAIAGATAASCTTPALTSADANSSYTVTVTNAAGSATSAPAILGVSAAAAPLIMMQPASQTVAVGETLTFTVVASATTPMTYQWFRNGAAIAGATNASYTIPVAAAGDGANFTVAVSNATGTTTSATAVLTVASTALDSTQSLAQAKSTLALLVNTTGNIGSSFFPTQGATLQTDLAGATPSFGAMGRNLSWLTASIANLAAKGGTTLTGTYSTGCYQVINGAWSEELYPCTLTFSGGVYTYSIDGGADGLWTGTASGYATWPDGSVQTLTLKDAAFPGEMQASQTGSGATLSVHYAPVFSDLVNLSMTSAPRTGGGYDQSVTGTVATTPRAASSPTLTLNLTSATWTQYLTGGTGQGGYVWLPQHAALTMASGTYTFTGTLDFTNYQSNPTVSSAVADGPSAGWPSFDTTGTTFTKVHVAGSAVNSQGGSVSVDFLTGVGNYATLALNQPAGPSNVPALFLGFTGTLQVPNQPLMTLLLNTANQSYFSIPTTLSLTYGTTTLTGTGTAYPRVPGQTATQTFVADLKDQTGIEIHLEADTQSRLTGKVTYAGTQLGTISDVGFGVRVSFTDGTFQTLW